MLRKKKTIACIALLGSAGWAGRADASGAYTDFALSLNPTHHYSLDEAALGPARLDGGGNKIGTASGVGGFQYDGPVLDTGTGPALNGYYEGFFAGVDTGNVATVGATGPGFAGFDIANLAFDANRRGSVNLGDGTNFASDVMTVSFWMRGRNAHAGDRYFTNNTPSSADHFQVTMGNAANLLVCFDPTIEDSAASRQVKDDTLRIKDNQWHHVVASRNGATLSGFRVVVDGHDFTADLADTTTGWGNTPDDAHIGSRDGGDGGGNMRTATGALDEVSVFLNRQLTVAESKALYDAAVPPGAALSAELPKGGAGKWGVRTFRPAYLIKTGLTGVDQVLEDADLRVERNSTDSQVSTLNFANGGDGFSFAAPKDPLPAGARVDQYVAAANGTIRIPEDGVYTFGFDGDNAVRMSIPGANFTKQAGNDGVVVTGDTMETPLYTTDAYGLASTFLAAGDYPISVVYGEQYGGGFLEVFSSKGEKTAMDSEFALIGGQAAVYAQGTTPTIPGGFQVKELVRVPENIPETAIHNLAQAREAINNPQVTDFKFPANGGTQAVQTINATDPDAPSGGGKYGDDVPFLNDLDNTDDNDFVMLATGTVHIEAAGMYTFGFDTNNGASLTIDGADFEITRTVDGNVAKVSEDGSSLIFDSEVHEGGNYTLASTFLTAGDHDIEFLMFERAGGSSAELIAAVGEWNAFVPSAFTLLGAPGREIDLQSPKGLELVGDAAPQVGDTDGDGDVDLDDLNNVRNNFGATGVGDTDGDNDVDLDDLNNVRNNFGAGPAASVPEPGTFALGLTMLALGGLWVRRRRS